MCGIHFVATKNAYTYKLDDFLRDAFITNQVRGLDGTGMFQVQQTYAQNSGYKAKNVSVFKKDINASDFIGYSAPEAMLKDACRMPLTVGHVRAATHGAVSTPNTHPFIAIRKDESRIIGVHNGSLVGWKGNVDADKYEVDSQWLYSKIAEDGIEAFEGFDGAFALVWYDSKHPNTMFVARNSKRPLFWCFTEDYGAMMGCSELGMLGWLADRNELKLAKSDNNMRFFFPEPGMVHKINLNNFKDIKKEPFPEYNANKKKYAKPAEYNPPFEFRHPASSFGQQRGFPDYTRRQPVTSLVPAGGLDVNNDDDIWDETDAKAQAKLLGNIKAVLKAARQARTNVPAKEPKVVTGDDLENTLADEINTWLENRHGMKGLGYVEPIESPLDSTATPKESFTFVGKADESKATEVEVRRAKSIGIYGLVVQFCGYFYDDETCSVFGDFRTLENGENIVYDSIVRGQSRASGETKYINPSGLADMVVVGVTANEPANSGKPYLILVDKDPKAITTTVYNANPTAAVLH